MEVAQSISNNSRRRNACIPCTQAKRRCDKGLPACQRCIERETPCQYPSTRPYARRQVREPKAAERSELSPRDALRRHTKTTATVVRDLKPTDDLDCARQVEDVWDEEILSLNLRSSVDAQASSWFLGAETWAIDPIHPEPPIEVPRLRMSDLKLFSQQVRRWLLQWVQQGHCPFLHGQLYAETGLPPCLMDAFTAVAVYETKNNRNEELIMGIIDEKANGLLSSQPLEADPVVGSAPSHLQTVHHLARVQALFIYQFLRLFDGDIRQRALGEACIPTLTEWNSRLWESANVDACLQTSCGFDGLFSQDFTYGGGDNDASGGQWRDWLLSESIRRIWIVGSYLQCAYLAIRDGQAACVGGITFTARRGLWEAQSAATWMRLVRSTNPLFTSCYQTDGMALSVSAPEVDVFCLTIMSMLGTTQKLPLRTLEIQD
ncbi:hypothetical protein V8C42DRAFT_336347 [Trichoderma barbatum]